MIFISMKKSKSHKIENLELLKIEKTYRAGNKPKFYYNLTLENIEEPLLLIIEENISNSLIGQKIKYILNDDNIVSDFELL